MLSDQPRAVGRLLGSRRPGQPDVLADRQSDALTTHFDRRSRVTRLEVAPLVEHAVVGQMHLAVDRLDRPVGEHGGGVVDVLGAALREADDRDHAMCIGCQIRRVRPACLRGSARAAAGPRGVAGERELAEQRKIGFGLTSVVETRPDARRVAGDVAHRGVHLAERQPHLGASLSRQLGTAGGLGPRSSAVAGASDGLQRRFCAVGPGPCLARRLMGCRSPVSPAWRTPAARASEAIAKRRSRASPSSPGSAS